MSPAARLTEGRTGVLRRALLVFALVWLVVLPTAVYTRGVAFQDAGEWVYETYVLHFLLSGGSTPVAELQGHPVPYVLAHSSRPSCNGSSHRPCRSCSRLCSRPLPHRG